MKKNKDDKQRREQLSLGKLFSGDFFKFIEENATEELLKNLP